MGTITSAVPQFVQSPLISFLALGVHTLRLWLSHDLSIPQMEGLRPRDMGSKLEDRLLYAANTEPCCMLLMAPMWAQGCSCLVGRWEDKMWSVAAE